MIIERRKSYSNEPRCTYAENAPRPTVLVQANSFGHAYCVGMGFELLSETDSDFNETHLLFRAPVGFEVHATERLPEMGG